MRFRKIILLLTAILLSASALYSQDTASATDRDFYESLEPQEKEFIKNYKSINVVCDNSWPPFEYIYEKDNLNDYSGININYLKRAAKALDLTVNFIYTRDSEENGSKLKSSTADLSTGYTKEYSDIPGVRFSDPLFKINVAVASKTGKLPSAGETIITAPLSEEDMKELKKLFPENIYKIRVFKNPDETIKNFRKSKYKYAVLDEFEIADEKTMKSLRLFPTPISYSMAIAFSPSMPEEAVSAFNKAFRYVAKDFDTIVLESRFERKAYSDNLTAVENQKKSESIILGFLAFLICTVVLLFVLLVHKKRQITVEYDDLTSLYSPKYFKHLVKEQLKNAKPAEYMILAVDINNFSVINDSFSNEAGNALLIELARHFSEICESEEAIATRLSGDNFIFFLKNPGLLPAIEDFVCLKLTNIKDHVAKILPGNYKLEFSSGVYYIENTSESVTSMIEKANLARKKGKEIYSTPRTYEYTRELEHDIRMKRDITLSMKSALEAGEFEVYYQPKFRFSDEVIVGAEALIRWNNSKKGFLNPGDFVPLFEQNGFIKEIDFFVFEKVCKFLNDWNHSGENGTCPHPITISFNLSRKHLEDNDLVQHLKNIVSKYEIKPSRVEVELTESIMFDNPKKLVATMNKIKQAGFSISVDDFGAGYSSLNLLKDIPADVLKLDKEFLSSAKDQERENVIINSVIDMAKKLNLTTVAEGVETETQSDLLKNMGCDIVQGFLFAKPMKEHEYRTLLEEAFIK